MLDIQNANPRLPRSLFPAVARVVLIGLGLLWIAQPTIGKEPEAAKTTEKTGAEKSAAKADHAAIEELRDLAERAYEETLGFYESGDAFAQEVYRWSRAILDHDLELAHDDEKKLLSTQAHLDRMNNLAHAGLWRRANWNIT